MRRVGVMIRSGIALGTLLVFYLVTVLFAYSLLATADVTAVLGSKGAIAVLVGVTLVVMGLHYWIGVRRILSRLDAERLAPDDHARLYDGASNIADAVGVTTPTIYLAPIDEPNALGVGGPYRGRLILSRSLLKTLESDEIEAIMAHEMVHLKHRDTIVQSLAHSIVRIVGGITWLIFLVIGLVSSVVAILVGRRPREVYEQDVRQGDLKRQSAVAAMLLMVVAVVFIRLLSRQRECMADLEAVNATQDVGALARALRKIDRAGEDPQARLAAPPSLFVVGAAEVLRGKWFDTHPGVERRIERLADRFPEEDISGDTGTETINSTR